jgi:CPA2 family monovalent cation:H+ antiporter-2
MEAPRLIAHPLASLAAAATTETQAAGPDVLSSLAIILCVAAVTTVVFQRIHQPVVLGYLLAGLIVGPHMPVPLFADQRIAHLFSDLGVILLMFSLGLEFTLRKLARVGPTAGVIAIIECSLMIGLGYAAAGLLGWTPYERLFAGAFVAISSTTIIVKAFAERQVEGRLGELVFGILIVEDVVAILLLAVLTTIASGAGLSAGALAATVGRLGAFLVGMLVVGMLVIPRLVRLIVRVGRKETIVVACVGICFASALVARSFGYSVALGAFLGGVLVAESGEARTVEHVIEPVKDVFAAVFFVSVGMLIDPRLVAAHAPAIALLALLVVAGKVLGVTLGAFLAGNGVRTSVQAGMSLAQIGEFSFIIVGVGLSLGVVRDFLYPVAVAISAVTTLLTPWMVRASGRAANALDRRLPHVLQTYAGLYGTWVAGLRASPQRRGTAEHRTAWSRIRRLVLLLFIDVALVAAVAIGTSLAFPRSLQWLVAYTRGGAGGARVLLVGGAVALAAPFAVGAVRVARGLGLALAAEALPATAGRLDLAAAPRRALLVSLQIAILLVAGLPLVAVTQPFLPRFPLAALLGLGLLALAVPLWRGAADLHGHVRAGAQVILEALGTQSHTADAPTVETTSVPTTGDEVQDLLPGMGRAGSLHLKQGDHGVGRSLKETNLRGETGALVIAIQRASGAIFPSADERFAVGDTLVLTGSEEAVAAARALLTNGPERAM